ncbi:Ubiquitin thioesterase OTU1 [Orchesella cincta]|uniref:Ubiquitin thioesterase OTU n=1 Tax=Orchesella cincta TaxID=48709 RepID=A0A1D2M369_ORCCI|nr:Ubiquitin thioesterase OTU1 [Orchesella cincta]
MGSVIILGTSFLSLPAYIAPLFPFYFVFVLGLFFAALPIASTIFENSVWFKYSWMNVSAVGGFEQGTFSFKAPYQGLISYLTRVDEKAGLAMASGSKKLTLRVKSLMSQTSFCGMWIHKRLFELSAVTGVPEGNMALLRGFLPADFIREFQLVESLGLQNQDNIFVVLDKSVTSNSTRLVGDDDSGLLLRHTVPSDNSCLFTSVAFCLSGGQRLQGDSSSLREMIANTVAADPEKFNEAFLARPNADYVKWIKEPESWGGGIELAILSEFYGMQISVVNTQSVHISNFGEDQNFAERIFLVYDGVHYDPLYFEPFNGGSTRTKFEVRNTRMNDLAMQLAHEAHASHQFTDLNNFSLRCQICNALLKGQEEAQAHAKKTAHTAFAEIKK